MAVPARLCTPDGVITAIGGPSVAAPLLDERKTGEPWIVLVDKAIVWGTNRVLMAYGVQNQVQDLVPPYPPALVMLAEWFSAAQAWTLGGKGITAPARVTANEALAEKLCDQMVARTRSTATDPEAANQHELLIITPSADVTVANMKGYW